MSIAKELTKEFFRPVIMVFWFGLLLAVLGGITFHFIDKTIAEAKRELVVPMQRASDAVAGTADCVAETVSSMQSGVNNVAQGISDTAVSIKHDWDVAVEARRNLKHYLERSSLPEHP